MSSADCQSVFVNTSAEAALYGYKSEHVIFVSTILPIILAIGIIINSLFIYVVYRVTFMHTITGCYLANLAVADMLFLLAAVIPKVMNYIGSPIYPDDTPIGISGCILGYVLSNTAYFSTLLFITYISWERYRAVCRPHQKSLKWKHITLMVVLTWLISFGFSLSFIPAFANFVQNCIRWPESKPYTEWPPTQSFCVSISPIADSYADGAQTTPFFVCLIINLTLSCYIIKGLRDSIARLHGHSQGSQKQRLARERSKLQITRMLLINSALFFILLSPFEFLSLSRSINIGITGEPFTFSPKIASTFGYVFRILSYMNSMINPIIYTVFSQRFQKAFSVAFCGNSSEAIDRSSCRILKPMSRSSKP